MSAFICNDYHISVLAYYASRHLSRYRGADPQHLGELLHRANVRSVNHRYNEVDPEEGFLLQRRAGLVILKPVAIIKAANCLEYQSCEPEDWETAAACHLLQAIINRAIHDLPGYEQAAWELKP